MKVPLCLVFIWLLLFAFHVVSALLYNILHLYPLFIVCLPVQNHYRFSLFLSDPLFWCFANRSLCFVPFICLLISFADSFCRYNLLSEWKLRERKVSVYKTIGFCSFVVWYLVNFLTSNQKWNFFSDSFCISTWVVFLVKKNVTESSINFAI